MPEAIAQSILIGHDIVAAIVCDVRLSIIVCMRACL